ncbi:MAG: HAMP domain-containing sensor histidine kinase [Bacteroidota bacterium]
MKLYQFLSSIKFLRKSYAGKFLFVAFLGIHVPLIGLLIYIGLSYNGFIEPMDLILITLGLTLGATAITLFVLNKLLQPVSMAKSSLEDYIQHNRIPDLPLNHTDEVGLLLSSIQHTINSLEDVNRTKTDLMQTITHDLRTPLSQIVSLTYLFESSEQEEQQKIIKQIRQSAEQELDFITNYIAMIETSDFVVNKTTKIKTNLLELTQSVAGKVGVQLSAKRLNLQLDITPSIHITTPNPAIFERVIQNLLTNAIKFSHYNSAIRIQAREDNGKIKITVADHGIGFNQQDAEQLFLKFTPLKRLGTLNEPTNGIGLFLTSEIVALHQGKIWATSNGPDSGSQFHVELPA